MSKHALPETMAEAQPGRVYETEIPECLYWLDDLGNCIVWLGIAQGIGLAGEPPERYTPVRYVGLVKEIFMEGSVDALRALLSPRTYDEGMDCWVIRANSDEAEAALELLAKIEGEG